MLDYNTIVETVKDVDADPVLLAKIAYEHPEFGANVAVNPRAYPGLKRWLAQFGNERARETLEQMGFTTWPDPVHDQQQRDAGTATAAVEIPSELHNGQLTATPEPERATDAAVEAAPEVAIGVKAEPTPYVEQRHDYHQLTPAPAEYQKPTPTPTPILTSYQKSTPTQADYETPTPALADHQKPTQTDYQQPTPALADHQKPTSTQTNYQKPTQTDYQQLTPALADYQKPTSTQTNYQQRTQADSHEPTPALADYQTSTQADSHQPTPALADYQQPTPTDSRQPTSTPTDSQQLTPAPADSQQPTPADSQQPTSTQTDYRKPTPTPADSQQPTPTQTDSQQPTPAPADSQKPKPTQTEAASPNPYGFTADQALDPGTDQVTLAQIARYAPELRPYLARNPNTYPALLDWLAKQHDPAIDAALATRLR